MKTRQFISILFALLIYISAFSQTSLTSQTIITTSADFAKCVYSIDLDGDGDNDVLSASYDDDKIAWYENLGDTDGDGLVNFSEQKIITTSADGALSVYSIDLDGDDDNDVLSASSGDGKISWYENLGDTDGDGSVNFSEQKNITTSASGARCVYSIDLDGDGDNDVLSSSFFLDDRIAWYENLGDTDGDGVVNFSDQKTITTSADDPVSVYAIDLDGDGDNDVLSASYADDKISWYENLGDTDGDGVVNFSSQKNITSLADGAESVYAIDLDGDGDNDVLSASVADNKIAWYKNLGDTDGDGSINFSEQKIINSGSKFWSVYSIDLDGDGDNDVLSASYDGDKIEWCENLGDTDEDGFVNFSESKIITSSADAAMSVFAIDLDRDGDNDVLSASENDDKIAWYENYTLEIKQQPQDVSIYSSGGTATFSIVVKDCTGYQWQVSTDGSTTFTDLTDDATYSGSTTDTLTVNSDGSAIGYQYRCVVSNNAGSQYSDTVSILLETAVETTKADFKVYPNPTNGKLTILTDKGNGTLQLTDLKGQVLRSKTVTTNISELDLSDLPAGMYLLYYTSSVGSFRTKVIKK